MLHPAFTHDDTITRCELVHAVRHANTKGVDDRLRFGFVNIIKQRCEDAPGLRQLSAANKERAVSVEGVEEHPFVTISHITARERCRIAHIQDRGSHITHLPARHLVHDLQVDCLIWLDAHHKLIGSSGYKLIECLRFEGNANFGHALIKALASTKQEGYIAPSVIVNLQDNSGISGTLGVNWYPLVVQVAWFLVFHATGTPCVWAKLAKETILHCNRFDCLEQFDLLFLH
mmetsp:Transcript_21552/g.41157  ORF Transcript_21552/g.41157 Transcript_21552/m.41157 type:complete len:231 (+) Transcript_21552:363-1055(+)